MAYVRGASRYAASKAELAIIGMEPAASASKAFGAGSTPPPCAHAVNDVFIKKERN